MKKKTTKLPIILALVAMFVIIAVVIVVIALNSGHRVIKVESFEGVVSLVRGSAPKDIVEGMNLKSEDGVTTGTDGLVELLVDEDKHILARENTGFIITASGSDKKGKLKIELAYGTSLIEIENKLEVGSEVEVITPNASLSVRGTTFETSYTKADNTTIIKVTDGVVSVSTATESEEVTAGEMAIVKDDEIEIKDMSIGYLDVSAFEARYLTGHDYSGVCVKELVGWDYETEEQTSDMPDTFVNNGVKIAYWVMTKDEVDLDIDLSGEGGYLERVDYLKNDDWDDIICATYDFNGTNGNIEIIYRYFKKVGKDTYLSIMVYDEDGGESLAGVNIETYLPITNNEYYIYDNSLSGVGTSEDDSSKKEVTLGTMEVPDENSSKKAILTYNADYYIAKEDSFIQVEGILSEISKEYDCSHGYRSGAHLLFVADSNAQEYYNNTQAVYAERGWTLSEMSTATVCGRTAYVFEEYWDDSMTVNKTHIVMEEEGSIVVFYIAGGNIFNVDGYIVELETFLIDMEIVD